MSRLSSQDHQTAMGCFENGQTQQKIANALCVDISTIYLQWHRFQATNITNDFSRSGSPRLRTAAHDRLVLRQHRQDAYQSASGTARNNVGTH